MRFTEQKSEIKILFVAADPVLVTAKPESASRLLQDEEIREIKYKVLATTHRDIFVFEQLWASRPNDLIQALNLHKPVIVHFSSHGSNTGDILLTDDNRLARTVNTAALKSLLSVVKNDIRIVILNVCRSHLQAKEIINVIDCAIGMNADITNGAAIMFASTFYQAIGYGCSIQEAFDQGKVSLQIKYPSEYTTPQLFAKKGVNPRQLYIIRDAQRKGEKDKNQQRLKNIESAIAKGYYSNANQEISHIAGEAIDGMSVQEQARLKYLEALIRLEGKRPSAQPLSTMKRSEELLHEAISLHRLFSYLKILAIIKQDFIQNGIETRKYKQEAGKLLRAADQLPVRPEDREIIRLFRHSQPQLSREYDHHLTI